MSENNGNSSNAPSDQPGQTEIIASDDAMYLRMVAIYNAVIDFYETIVTGPPEETEKFFKDYPAVAAARMRLAPIAISRILPIKKEIQQLPIQPRGKRITPGELVKAGVGLSELKRLAGGDS